MAYNKETGMYEGYIYKITNKLNGHCYIGQTNRTPEERWYEHTKPYVLNKKENKLYKAFNKYHLDDFQFEVIEIVSSETCKDLQDKLDELEVYYIDYYDSYTNGYNGTPGGQYIDVDNLYQIEVDVYSIDGMFLKYFKNCKEASLYYSISRSGISSCINGKIGQCNGLVFRKHGDPFNKYETDRVKKHCKNAYKFDRYGNLLGKYDTLKEAGSDNNIPPNNISLAIDNPNKTCAGFWWSSNGIFNGHNAFLKQIDQYTIYGKFLNTYDRLSDVRDKLGYSAASIQGVCCGRNTQAYGFVWRYHGDNFDKYKLPNVDQFRKVNKYTEDNIFINIFDTPNKAALSVGKKSGGILSCCRKERKTAYGFQWYFSDDPNQPDKSKIIS